MGNKFKQLPTHMGDWEIVNDLGIRKISCKNTFSGNYQTKHYVIIKCPVCGKLYERELGNLKSNYKRYKSLRCISEICKKGGLTNRYNKMVARCNNKDSKSYITHGAKGINVCKEWLDNPIEFIIWANTNGYKSGLFLDRRDNDKDYCPENCRWVTASDSALNRGIFKNNSTGYRGISRYKNPNSSKYRFKVSIGSKQRGKLKKYVDTMEEAIVIRDEFIKKLKLEEYY